MMKKSDYLHTGKILMATNNKNKLKEIRSVLSSLKTISVYSLNDFGITAEIAEDGKTLEDNALLKAEYVFRLLDIPAISDDTGLFVDALNGEPGIYSARYAGENASYSDNCKKLLSNLKSVRSEDRKARFESVICLYTGIDEYKFFKGICKGKIIENEKGTNGFGYDPVFVPDGMSGTFAELSAEEKNLISHRALALRSFREFIEKNN
ncbi:MAG TPA: RdgB/HAM1 family non-canonical purine NTP pyrophosphatase [Ignavibacteria bacterium]|nr:RdgB/HAM1 family non-canonical purine NTP pyrophosphatase [Ignavibacteria bacterium]HMR39143.1 RdgB/HAM1 family non-canonical purine NTP pyrophosphatase [Ignavibacteria bacterium]